MARNATEHSANYQDEQEDHGVQERIKEMLDKTDRVDSKELIGLLGQLDSRNEQTAVAHYAADRLHEKKLDFLEQCNDALQEEAKSPHPTGESVLSLFREKHGEGWDSKMDEILNNSHIGAVAGRNMAYNAMMTDNPELLDIAQEVLQASASTAVRYTYDGQNCPLAYTPEPASMGEGNSAEDLVRSRTEIIDYFKSSFPADPPNDELAAHMIGENVAMILGRGDFIVAAASLEAKIAEAAEDSDNTAENLRYIHNRIFNQDETDLAPRAIAALAGNSDQEPILFYRDIQGLDHAARHTDLDELTRRNEAETAELSRLLNNANMDGANMLHPRVMSINPAEDGQINPLSMIAREQMNEALEIAVIIPDYQDDPRQLAFLIEDILEKFNRANTALELSEKAKQAS